MTIALRGGATGSAIMFIIKRPPRLLPPALDTARPLRTGFQTIQKQQMVACRPASRRSRCEICLNLNKRRYFGWLMAPPWVVLCATGGRCLLVIGKHARYDLEYFLEWKRLVDDRE